MTPYWGFKTSRNFIAIAYLRMFKFKHQLVNPFVQAAAKCTCRVPHETPWSRPSLSQGMVCDCKT